MMYTQCEDDVVGIANNPDLLHVRIHGGRLWLSEDARHDIEVCAGHCPDTESPPRMLAFLRAACRRLQLVDVESDLAEHAFMSFCVLKGLEHAIDTHWQGVETTGAFEPEKLLMVFTSATCTAASLTLH